VPNVPGIEEGCASHQEHEFVGGDLNAVLEGNPALPQQDDKGTHKANPLHDICKLALKVIAL
jgi:hypothetical protein